MLRPITSGLSAFFFLIFSMGLSSETELKHAPSPPDNPLMGLVPYLTSDLVDRFPHSLEFQYFPLSELMTGPDQFDWSSFEAALALAGKRGCQLVTRIYLEYPGKTGIPRFLIDDGLGVIEWKSDDGVVLTPDYEDPKLLKALQSFIAAFGAKFDSDPRFGYLTAGLLGLWGEWHTYPRSEYFASKPVQAGVLKALVEAFSITPVLHRYPAGDNHYTYTKNAHLPFGYHDDSFAWATLDTGKPEDNWYFMPLLQTAQATAKWKNHPIGGEIRPELWETCFTDKPHPGNQGFARCVRETHVSWLMDSGMFDRRFPVSRERKSRAVSEVRKMGYSFHVPKWSAQESGITVKIENRGVAPFYRSWPVEIAAFRKGEEVWRETSAHTLQSILPGESKEIRFDLPDTVTGLELRIAVPNTMPTGKPVRFANETQGDLWLTLGTYQKP